jgi:hypothetical protein
VEFLTYLTTGDYPALGEKIYARLEQERGRLSDGSTPESKYVYVSWMTKSAKKKLLKYGDLSP